MAKKMKTMDGNNAAAYTAYAFTEVAAIYPITPSSTMAEVVDEWSANGQLNIFGQKVDVVEMQSEGGAAGAVHGSLTAGALTTTFTASQGLLLMLPNMYKIAGEFLPGVFHVSARAIAGHALSIFGDHSDVMATRQTGFALLASCSVQEAMDLGGVAHLASIKSSLPFLHFFDGFRTSHEIQNIEVIDYEDFERMLDKEALQRFKNRSLNPERPYTKGTAQNPDIFFQEKEAANRFYENVDDVVNDYMGQITELTGREYKPFQYYGDPQAENVIIAMGSVCEAIEETIDYLAKQGKKLGLVKVRLYRPFSEKYFFEALPDSVKRIAVLDRTKEPGSIGEPLYLDVRSAFYNKEGMPLIVGGRYGLGSKETTPSQIKAVYENLEAAEPKNSFTIGIVDDVTNLSLPVTEKIDASPEDCVSCKFWGLGSDGTVGANKSAIKIIGDTSGLYAQGYFDYDSKKSGGLTSSHLRFGRSPIRSTYTIDRADIVCCSMQSYLEQYDMVSDLKENGVFLLNTAWDAKELDENMPAEYKREIAQKSINFYTIDASLIAEEVGLGRKTNMIMEAAFFYLANVIPYDEAEKLLKEEVVENYGKKGEKILQMNFDGIERAISALHKAEVPQSWLQADVSEKQPASEPAFIKDILRPMTRKKGDLLPVSTFVGMEDGVFPSGTSAYEKRNIAMEVPVWNSENCIQCAQCSFVCPHAAIRPFLLTPEEAQAAPMQFSTRKPNGKALEAYAFRVQVSPKDCTGCGSCINVCQGKEKALSFRDVEDSGDDAVLWDYISQLPLKESGLNKFSVRGSQFCQPLLEFSGACEGCGETPYAKLLTQLFGDRMYIANATGCTSIWGASAPSIPYTKNAKGQGPAWANSLFEDNAEYGYGMALSVKKQRNTLKGKAEDLLGSTSDTNLKEALAGWITAFDDDAVSEEASTALVAALEATSEQNADRDYLLSNKEQLRKKSIWIFGGDGWAYDIGYGGLDHVLASGENLNVFVFDTEVYSNTGGQSSKSTPTAAVAKFAAQGKKVQKKDLGMMAASYGYVYVAQVSLADMNHLLKAVKEAESFDGPSIIIAYAPCINHGIKSGMGSSVQQCKNAVESGYWHHYRYNPNSSAAGANPFTLDSKPPTKDFEEFIKSETRYTALEVTFPEIAKELFAKSALDAKGRYEKYAKMAEQE